MATIAHYVSRGHSLRELVELRPGELRFLRVAWELELDYMKEALNIGNEKR